MGREPLRRSLQAHATCLPVAETLRMLMERDSSLLPSATLVSWQSRELGAFPRDWIVAVAGEHCLALHCYARSHRPRGNRTGPIWNGPFRPLRLPLRAARRLQSPYPNANLSKFRTPRATPPQPKFRRDGRLDSEPEPPNYLLPPSCPCDSTTSRRGAGG